MFPQVVIACLLAVAAANPVADPGSPSDVVLNIQELNQKHTQFGTAGTAVTGSYR